MKILIIGLGVQGKKRLAIAGVDCIGTVDPTNSNAQYKELYEVPSHLYDAALVCTPDAEKLEILRYLLLHRKHVLVEKPLATPSLANLVELKQLAEKEGLALYTAYNHRFEPLISRLKTLLSQGVLGKLYLAKFFYGNGTACDVRNSLWRDQGSGVLHDLGCHLLDLTSFLFEKKVTHFKEVKFSRFENRAFDQALFQSDQVEGIAPQLMIETSLLSWKNSFSIDIIGERGSVHLSGLCKWGQSSLTFRKRIFPSGKPTEETWVQECPDPTWSEEYKHFISLCQTGGNNIENDIWISTTLGKLVGEKL